MKKLLFFMAAALCLGGCRKAEELLSGTASVTATGFTTYTIRSGQHFCDGNAYRAIEAASVRFAVRFDSSAIYQTREPANQYDINKLWGFSDNGSDHHAFSARFGWRWSEGALRLFAYVYNNGTRSEQELTTVAVGAEVHCRIEAAGSAYRFTIDGQTWSLPRAAATALARGYRLYPYFGGDEPAPHDVRIAIREE